MAHQSGVAAIIGVERKVMVRKGEDIAVEIL